MNKILFGVFVVMIISAIGANFYTFYYQKNYDFIVETSCDETTHSCFVRDCSTGECPPNNLDKYRVFHMIARDFNKCDNNSCLRSCEDGSIKCFETKCGESSGDKCLFLTSAK